jgi:predicted ATPase
LVISQLNLRLFKCFEYLKLPLAPLTLLSGSNASGKSSALQALALLHQTMLEHEWSTRLMLNGSAIRLGTVADVVDKVHGRRSVSIGVIADDHDYEWTFDGDRAEMSMSTEQVQVDSDSLQRPETLRFLLPPQEFGRSDQLSERLRSLTYITAERVGPREVYVLEDAQTTPVVGSAGEHAVSVLHSGRDEHVIQALALPDYPTTRIRQVEARMRMFFPDCSIDVQQVPQANAVTLGLRTSNDTDFHRPIHVGFGLTQVFPILVAALSARAHQVILIENPEVHLHPAGQARMGQFLAEVAQAGIQVIVETHSDHVLNGLRRAVRDQYVAPEFIAIHFFSPRSIDGTQVVSPQIDGSGNIDFWPDGFFDQFDKDTTYFAGWAD